MLHLWGLAPKYPFPMFEFQKACVGVVVMWGWEYGKRTAVWKAVPDTHRDCRVEVSSRVG